MIMPFTEIQPPTDTTDFQGEFVESLTHTFRTSIFGGTMRAMTLATHEPAALQLGQSPKMINTEVDINIEIEAVGGKIDTTSLTRLFEKLRNIRFKSDAMIRAKTFYSTTAISKLPGESHLTERGQMRLSNASHKIESEQPGPNSWHYITDPSIGPTFEPSRDCLFCSKKLACAAGDAHQPITKIKSNIPAGKWKTRIRVPVKVPSDLAPNFCSAIVSRQYTLITRIKVNGARIKNFTLEVPLQITHPSPESNGASAALQGLDNSNDAESAAGVPPTVSSNGAFDVEQVVEQVRRLLKLRGINIF